MSVVSQDESLREQLIRDIRSQFEAAAQLKNTLAKISSERTKLRAAASKVQQCVEVEEEHISNVLFRRLGNMKREKELLSEKVRVEEALSEKLRAKLDQVKRDKAEIDISLEREQEYIIHKLHRKLGKVATERAALESQLQQERSGFLAKVHAAIERKLDPESQTVRAVESDGSLDSRASQKPQAPTRKGGLTRQNSELLILQLEKDVVKLLGAQRVAEEKSTAVQQECESLAKKLERLNTDSFLERAKAKKAKEELDMIHSEVDLQNRQLQQLRQSPSLVSQSPSLTSSMDVSGQYPICYSGGSSAAYDREAMKAHTERLLSAPTLPSAHSNTSQAPSPFAPLSVHRHSVPRSPTTPNMPAFRHSSLHEPHHSPISDEDQTSQSSHGNPQRCLDAPQ